MADMIRARTLELVNRGFEIALDNKTDPKEALTAIFGLLDRGWGKPKEREEEGGGKGDITQVLSDLIAKLPS